MDSPSAWKVNACSPTNHLLRDERPTRTHGNPSPHRGSPQRNRSDSPAMQLVEEFGRLLLDQDHSLQSRLNEESANQDKVHKIALAQAAAEHERVRQNAERARERLELEIERERKKRDTESLRALEAERQAKVEREQAELKQRKEALQREAEDRERREAQEREIRESTKRLAEQKRKDESEAAARKRQESEADERKRQEGEDAKRRAREATDAATARLQQAKAAQASQPAAEPVAPPIQSQPPSQPLTIASAQQKSYLQAERENLHKRYIELHKQLKQMREHVVTEGKKNPALKDKLGDWRREIVKCMGQLTADKTKNRQPLVRIQNILQESLKYTEPSIDVSQYLISHQAPSSPLLVSGTFIYLMNIFTKSIIRQFIYETSGGAKSADPVGVVAVTIFAAPALKLNQSIPLIDVLLAKFHVVCPVLWGIYGPQNTAAGRARVGWIKEGGDYIDEQRHIERVTGLAAGFASLSLRDFSKSRNENPYPNTNYWHVMANIINVPTQQLQTTHLTVLRGLIDGFVPRFIGFYGQAAVAVLRLALVEVPNRARSRGDKALAGAADQVVVLNQLIKRDLKLTL